MNRNYPDLDGKRVLVTGANGFIGRELVQHLRDSDVECRAAIRSGQEGVAVGNIDASTDWSQALAGCDAVVHTAGLAHQVENESDGARRAFFAVNTEGTLSLARQAAAAGVKRIVFLSSIKAMGESGHFTRDDKCHPEDAYGESKLAAEQGLWEIAKETGLEIVTLRLPLVYGPGVKGNYRQLEKLVESGIPLPFGRVNNARSLISLSNLVDLISVCLTHPNAAGKVYLPSDGAPISTRELILNIGKSTSRKPLILPVPVSLMRFAARLAGKSGLVDRLIGDLTVDCSPLKEELGWEASHAKPKFPETKGSYRV